MTDLNVTFSEGAANATSLGLLARARQNDPIAWQRLVDLYEPLIRYWCRQAGLQPADVADVRQEVCAAVLQYLKNFHHEGSGSFRAWLRRITQTKIANLFRKGMISPGNGGTSARHDLVGVASHKLKDPDDAALSAELRVLYRQAMQLIQSEYSDQTWKLFWRVVIDGASPADVATDFQTTVNTVYLAKSRVLARLREEFVSLIDG